MKCMALSFLLALGIRTCAMEEIDPTAHLGVTFGIAGGEEIDSYWRISRSCVAGMKLDCQWCADSAVSHSIQMESNRRLVELASGCGEIIHFQLDGLKLDKDVWSCQWQSALGIVFVLKCQIVSLPTTKLIAYSGGRSFDSGGLLEMFFVDINAELYLAVVDGLVENVQVFIEQCA